MYRAFASLNVTFSTARLLAAGVAEPPRFVDYLARCVRTGENEPSGQQMARESR